ncbi:MAG TPA: tetratricopeptide repeat protein [Verrucomicrobiae bacterium]|nr:tetratricopeptide repeat protein [Verrucomicrobiae bacterium]
MRTRWVVLTFAAVLLGAIGGAMLAPQPASAVSRDMIELQQQVAQLLQGQQDMRSAMDSNNATIKTLVQQSLDSVNKLSAEMSSVQKSVQEVQANTGARIDTMAQQTQGLSDNLQDVQARVGKLSQQLSDAQNLLQSIDGKLSNQPGATGTPGATGAPGSPGATGGPTTSNDTPGGNPPPGMAPISADTLYQNALRDYTSGKYDLARQEFSDYIKNFPSNDLASNSQFYLGEIAYAQGDFKQAIGAYNAVLVNYPRSFKLAASQLKKGMAELESGERAAGIRDLRTVESHFPGSDESRRAHAKLREVGATTTSRAPAR